MNHDTKTLIAYLLIGFAVIALVLVAFMINDARASAACMTKSEARSHWRTAHLYWSGPDHCWSNQRGRHYIRRLPKIDPGVRAQATAPIKIVKADEFNELDALAEEQPAPLPFIMSLMPGPGTVEGMLDPMAMTKWSPFFNESEPRLFNTWDERVTGQFK